MSRARTQPRLTNVFVNCPFDSSYKPLLDATIFAIHDLGFKARHALIDDGDAVRLTRIAREIGNSKYSIHDISRVESSGILNLPRFNMPFEAGIAYCHHYRAKRGSEHHLLVLDSESYRYHASLSDVAGLDAKIHDNDPEKIVGAVRSFLVRKSGGAGPGAAHIWKRYGLFLTLLEKEAARRHLTMAELRSLEYVSDLQDLMAKWISANPP